MTAFFAYTPAEDGSFDPVRACVEDGSRALLMDRGELPATFFDLSTGVAGELVQRLTLYGIRMAAVVPDVESHSAAFQDFAREANHRGTVFRFFATCEQAEAWLATTDVPRERRSSSTLTPIPCVAR